MTSRYSRIFLRPPKGTTLSSESWGGSSTAEPRSTDSQGFSYPPSGSLPSQDTTSAESAMASRQPHPYTFGAVYSAPSPEPREPPRPPRDINAVGVEKQQAPGPSAQTPQYQRVARQQRRVSSIMPPPVPLRLRPHIILMLFLPVPPLLSLLYMATGHALLRAAHPDPTSIYRASSVLASLEAGATGGVILTTPLAILLYILVLMPRRTTDAPEDFFEDDASSLLSMSLWRNWISWGVTAIFLFTIGGIAGPLGVACLMGNVQSIDGRKLVSTGGAAAAGFVGGAVIGSASVVVAVVVVFIWARGRRQPASL